MVFTMVAWIVLYISYAMFYVNLMPSMPGVAISKYFIQDMLLGALIAVGN